MPSRPSTGHAAKRIAPAQAAGLVQSGQWVDCGFSIDQPDVVDQALGARASELRDVKVCNCLTIKPRAILEKDAGGQSFGVFKWHFGGYDRRHHGRSRVSYNPINLGEVADCCRGFIDHVDVARVKVCPEDENGIYSFGGAYTYQKAMLEKAKVVNIEVSTAMSYVLGPRNGIHRSNVDFVIDGDHTPITEVRNPPVTEHGIVNPKGKPVPERVKALISIAHPDFREALAREARKKGISPRWFR